MPEFVIVMRSVNSIIALFFVIWLGFDIFQHVTPFHYWMDIGIDIFVIAITIIAAIMPTPFVWKKK